MHVILNRFRKKNGNIAYNNYKGIIKRYFHFTCKSYNCKWIGTKAKSYMYI